WHESDSHPGKRRQSASPQSPVAEEEEDQNRRPSPDPQQAREAVRPGEPERRIERKAAIREAERVGPALHDRSQGQQRQNHVRREARQPAPPLSGLHRQHEQRQQENRRLLGKQREREQHHPRQFPPPRRTY